MEQYIGKILGVGIIGTPAAAKDLTVIPGIDLLVVIVVFDIFYGKGYTKVLLPHLRHRSHI